MGRSYLPLAEQGLDTLELWRDTLPESVLKPYYPQILPYLDAYLKTSTDISNFTFESVNWNNFLSIYKSNGKYYKDETDTSHLIICYNVNSLVTKNLRKI